MILNVPAVLPDNTLAPASLHKKFAHSFAGLGQDGADDSVNLFSGTGVDSDNGSTFYGPTDQQLLGLTTTGTPVSGGSGAAATPGLQLVGYNANGPIYSTTGQTSAGYTPVSSSPGVVYSAPANGTSASTTAVAASASAATTGLFNLASEAMLQPGMSINSKTGQITYQNPGYPVQTAGIGLTGTTGSSGLLLVGLAVAAMFMFMKK